MSQRAASLTNMAVHKQKLDSSSAVVTFCSHENSAEDASGKRPVQSFCIALLWLSRLGRLYRLGIIPSAHTLSSGLRRSLSAVGKTDVFALQGF